MKLTNIFSRLLKPAAIAIIGAIVSLGLSGYSYNWTAPSSVQISMLAQGDAITDPTSLLRYALPIDNEKIRKVQKDIEEIATYLRGKRWGPINSNLKSAAFVLKIRRDEILASVPEEHQPEAETIIDEISAQIPQLQEVVESKDKEAIWLGRREILDNITILEELMVTGFPFTIPSEYADLPQLKGRAIVNMETTQGYLTIVVDGYSAPINGGNFVDLVQRGFYDGLDFIRAEDFYVIQAGDPPGPEEGFIDPNTGEYRAIPIEVLVKGDELPIYGATLEEMGIYLPELALPFNAYGAVALARPGDDPNGGSSQFFFFKFDREVTPPGFNLMDGRYSVFGYVVEGKEVLEKLTADDQIISAKVIAGSENLVVPSETNS